MVFSRLKKLFNIYRENKNLKIAVLITGDVRDCTAKETLKDIFSDCDVFCASYVKHRKFISNIGKNNYSHLINEMTDIRLPFGITQENMQGNMLQWLHLDNIIKSYEQQLLKYDVILKFRFDYLIEDKSFLNKVRVHRNKLFNHSDLVFYSESHLFLKIFKGFYDKLTDYTYDPSRKIQDDSLESSWKSEGAFRLHLKKLNVINARLQFKKGFLDRGNHQKEYADSNKRLYSKNNSFSSSKYWSS